MDFSKIIAVSGKPGLYLTISQTKSGFIVESLIDKKRFPITTSSNVSLLENIAIYTYEEEIPLLTVFKSIYDKEKGKKALSHKESNHQLVAYFSEVLPDYDADRVYASNIKKVIQWYNILVLAGMDFSAVQSSQEDSDNA